MNDYDVKVGAELYSIVKDFIDKQNIIAEECVYQSDHVIVNAYEFVAALCNVVGYKELEDE